MTALSDAEAVLARVAGEHVLALALGNWRVCNCGEDWTPAHVAAEQIAALTDAMGLREDESGYMRTTARRVPGGALVEYDGWRHDTRLTTDWQPTDTEDDDRADLSGPAAEHHADRDDREYGELRDRRAEG